MKYRNSLTAGALVALLATAGYAQSDEPQSTTPEPPAFSVELVDDMIEDYLSEMGWQQGPNNGGKLIVAVGVGDISAKPGTRTYLEARSNAFSRAMLSVKQEMAKYLGQDISRRITSSYEEPELIADLQAHSDALEAKRAKDEELGLMDKGMLLINNEVDRLCEEQGIDLSTNEGAEEAQEVVKQLLLKTEFSDISTSMAKHECAGLSAFKTFDSQPEGEGGEVGVICVWTEKTNMLAHALLGRGDGPPKKDAKEPVGTQITSDPQTLACSFGVQVFIDENGDVVLVSYGHAAPRSKSKKAIGGARGKALDNADKRIRSFAGEFVATSSTQASAETYEEFEDVAGNISEVYANENSFKDLVDTVADDLNIAGMTTLKRQVWTHPVTGNLGYTVVRMWSTASSDQARKVADILAESAGSKGGKGRGTPTPPKDKGGDKTAKPEPKPLEGSRKKGGQAGDAGAID